MNKNRKLAAILFADMNERFLTKRKNESPVDFQVKEPRRYYVKKQVVL